MMKGLLIFYRVVKALGPGGVVLVFAHARTFSRQLLAVFIKLA